MANTLNGKVVEGKLPVPLRWMILLLSTQVPT